MIADMDDPIAYVGGLIREYTLGLKSPFFYKVGVPEKIEHLRKELAVMMTDSTEGSILRGRWAHLLAGQTTMPTNWNPPTPWRLRGSFRR